MNNILLRIAALSNQRTLVFMVIATAVFYFTLFDDGSSIDAQMASVNQMLQQEKSKAVESQKALNEVEKIRSQVGALGEQFRLAAQQLPAELQMAEILRSMDTIARSAGVSIKSKEPMSPTKTDILETTPLKISATGSYSELTMFLYYISSMERITRVSNLRFTVMPKEVKGNYNVLMFEGQIANYRYMGERKK